MQCIFLFNTDRFSVRKTVGDIFGVAVVPTGLEIDTCVLRGGGGELSVTACFGGTAVARPNNEWLLA